MAQVEKIDIQFMNLRYDVQIGYRKPVKQILKGINGIFKSGELTAIMGPSGAGKSTLLNILSGFLQGKITGNIEYIGKHGKKNWEQFKKQLCYIQQDDSLYDFFTVHEAMMIAAYLKIGNITHKYRQMLISDILETLNLLKIKDTRTERLSGGQKKRLSIALELIDNLPVMFLDEPTTGLDSLSSMQCITALKTLAKTGRTIICTIHQPSAALYEIFDHVYLLVDGYCTYAGKPSDTVNYFSQQGFLCPKYHNPADYMLEVVTKEYGDCNSQLISAANQYCQRNEMSHAIEEITNDKKDTKVLSPPSEITRFFILFRRYVLLLRRDWSAVNLKLIVHFLVAILIGLLYDHAGQDGSKTISNIGYMIVSVVYLMYTSMMPAVLKFPLELAVLRKERFNNWYQLRTYYYAMIVTNIPLQIVFSFIYSTISYLLSNQILEWSRYLMYLLISILTTFIGECLGQGLGTILNPVNGTFLGSITVCVMVLLAGFLALFIHMPVFMYYFSYLNCLRYALHGLAQAIYGYNREKLYCPSHMTYCHFRQPLIALEELDMARELFWLDAGVLFAHIVILRIVIYVMLKKRLSKIY